VGATTLVGKELADALTESSLAESDIVLLDEEDSAGQMTAAGDEAAFIQKIDGDSFTGIDFVFFAGTTKTTLAYWKTARQSGASIVDMTYALEKETGVVLRCPWAAGIVGDRRGKEPDLTTPAVVAAHPAAVMLLLIANRLNAKFPVRTAAATIFEPASEHGQAAMDELHQQTVSLLSFQSVPREQYGAQVAFNLLPSLGEAAKVNLAAVRERIADHTRTLLMDTKQEIALQVVQAPVFHGYMVSMLVELEKDATVEEMELAAHGEHIDLVAADSEPPSNLSATGQADVLVRISSAGGQAGPSQRFWIWMAADNLKLAALNGIACANELRRLRPQGKVQ